MKTTIKILLTLTGMLSAVIITSSNLKANEKTANNKNLCGCRCGSSLSDRCGITSSGTVLYGTFYETSTNTSNK
jgi:hypothetical protein